MGVARTDKSGRHLLVTVGTTKFDALIDAIMRPSVKKVLLEAGYSEWRVQYGAASSNVKDRLLAMHSDAPSISSFDYRPSLEDDIEWADLVIGHAGTILKISYRLKKSLGAGTVLDVLRGPISGRGKARRPGLLIVCNDDLMDRHQSELADELSERKACAACSIQQLIEGPEELIRTAELLDNGLPSPNYRQLNQDLRSLFDNCK
jgi:beta-1,4-N-acetylglucosaminyltransferase